MPIDRMGLMLHALGAPQETIAGIPLVLESGGVVTVENKKDKAISKEEAKARLEAKLDLINALRQELDTRAEDIIKALKRMEEEYEPPKQALATEKQVGYAMRLARQAGKELNESELRRMTRGQVSQIIDELLKTRSKP
jgi:hypothetical protein